MTSFQALTVQEAYSIDNKIDDSLPQSGNVTALVGASACSGAPVWAMGGSCNWGAHGVNGIPTTVATPYNSLNCYDNNNVAGPQTYSLANATLANCALSFQFQ